MDFGPSTINDACMHVSSARPAMGNIVDILGEAESIVRGLKSLYTNQQPDFYCPPLRIGRPIHEPLDSSLEPTPLGPEAFLPKLIHLRTHGGMPVANFLPKWLPNASAAYCQSQVMQEQALEQQVMMPMLPVLAPSVAPLPQGTSSMDLSLSSLDDTPLNLEYIDDLDAPSLIPSSARSSQSDLSVATGAYEVESNQPGKKRRVRKYKEDQWNVRFQELLQFRSEEGHVMVPHSYPQNQKLAQWVKRQRYQFRLKQMGNHSTLSDAREDILNEVGFVWDSHRATWSDHFQTLEAFAMANGHCYIPPQMAKEMASLITWCKHQRRQYKRYQAGLDSTMTAERIRCLESIGFDWDPRNLSAKKSTN